MDFLWRSLVIGIGGTAAMDLWALVLTAVFGMPLPNWGLVGRWFAHLSKGTFFHADITAAQAIPNEIRARLGCALCDRNHLCECADLFRRTRMGFKSNLSSGMDCRSGDSWCRLVHTPTRHGRRLGRIAAPQSDADTGAQHHRPHRFCRRPLRDCTPHVGNMMEGTGEPDDAKSN